MATLPQKRAKMEIFTIKDTKAEAFHAPFYQRTQAEAVRSFAMTTNSPQTQINEYPEDFDLYHLGSFDDRTGKMTILDTPEHIQKATNVLKKEQ